MKRIEAQNRCLNVLIDPSFQGVNRLFALSFECDDVRKSYKQYYLPTVEIKDYNVVIDGRNFYQKKNNLKYMIPLKRLKLAKVMISQLDVCQITLILNNTIN